MQQIQAVYKVKQKYGPDQGTRATGLGFFKGGLPTDPGPVHDYFQAED